MPNVKNTFTEAKMNKDVDSRLMPTGQYRDALNFRVSNSEGEDAGAGENSLSNKKLTNFTLGANPTTIGMYGDEFAEKLYWFVKSDTANYVLEYDNVNEVGSIVLEDSRAGTLNVLNFDGDYLITGVNIIIDTDNNVRFLAWTDGLNPPRYINIERAKGYGANGFGDDEISTYKKPPLSPPTLALTDTSSDQENNLEEKFLAFATRNRYLDGEYSALSPFTEYAFEPKQFNYDYSISSNESMINRYSAAIITFNTGDDLVTDVEVVFKESGSSTVYVVETFNKLDKGWGDETDVQFSYSNSKIDRVLASTELTRLYDNVPLTAFAQDVLGNRLMYAQYTENINIQDCDGNPIKASIEADYTATAIVDGTPTKTMKSNRDYELGIVYTYGGGRMTTPLTSEGNTIFIPTADCINQNKLTLQINHTAPCDAESYRVFVKQSKTLYDTIVPTLFYQDGVYVWIKLEGNEIDKINIGDFVFVKADSSEILTTVKQTKVLDIQNQPRNFLDETITATLEQLQGTYFKVKPSGFRINADDFELYEFSGYDNTRNKYDTPIRNNISYIEDPVLYGLSASPIMTQSGTYTGTVDVRYLIEIETVGTPDTFRWSNDDGLTWTSGVAVTGGAQLLENGVSITFGATTGHDIDDYWIVSAKSSSDNSIATDMNSKAYAIFKGIGDTDTEGDADVIEGGARIIIRYDEYGESIEYVEETFISSQRYANIEEWFYGDAINLGIVDSRIWFRRGTVGDDGNAKYIEMDTTKEMSMIIRTLGTQNNDADNRAKVRSFLSIFQSDSDIIFETKPLDTNLDIFYEVGRTYGIDANGYHLGFDVGDTSQTVSNSASIVVDLFNAFAWGNGFESYKIKDLLTTNSMGIDTRPSSPIRDYRENNRISSITYSGVYEQSTNINGLNEFNLSLANFKDLDDKYGKIEKIYGRDTNLLVFQEDKVLQVLFDKSILYNADGSGNVSQNLNVLGQEIPYAGEYGISGNPESFAIFGNQIWFTDSKRGAVMRLSIDGLTEISKYGMEDWFRDDFITNPNSKKLGEYDPYFDQYTLTLGEEPVAPVLEVPCGANLYKSLQTEAFTYVLKLNTLDGDIDIGYSVTGGSVNITATFNSTPYTTGTVSGAGTLSFTRDTLLEDEVTVVVTPVSSPAEYTLTNTCPLGEQMSIISIIVNDADKAGTTMTSRYKWDTSSYYSEIPVFEADGVTLFETNTGIQGLTRYPIEGATVRMEAYKDYVNDGDFEETEANSLSYLISSTVYTDADIATIQSLATPLTLTQINDGGVPETNYGSFTMTRPIGDEILYLIWNYVSLAINRDTYIYIYFDSSGSMASTEAPLGIMRDTLLQDALLPFYDNDPALYASRVTVISQSNERTIDMLNINGNTPDGNVVSLVFQDEANSVYHGSTFSDTDTRTATYDSDLATFRARLASFDPSYYRGVVFQVIPNSGTAFKDFMTAIQNGTNNYAGANGLSDRTEIVYTYDVTDGGTPAYYLTQVTDALTALGFDLTP